MTTAEPAFTRADAIADASNYLEQCAHVLARYQQRFGCDAPADPMADVTGPAAVAVRMLCAKADVSSALRMLREAAALDHPPVAHKAPAGSAHPAPPVPCNGGHPPFGLPATPRVPSFASYQPVPLRRAVPGVGDVAGRADGGWDWERD